MDLIKFSHEIIKYNFTMEKYNDLLSYFGLLQLHNFRIKRTILKEINFNSMKGGGGDEDNNLEEFVVDKNKYIARLVHGDSTDIKGKTHTIKFVSVDDINEQTIMCAILNFDYERKIVSIQSIGDYNNCLLCANRKEEYKVGEMLMIIIINICLDKKPKIKYIELKDNSTLSCMVSDASLMLGTPPDCRSSLRSYRNQAKTYPDQDIEWKSSYQHHHSLILRIIKTLTTGEPYYCKYGFKPKTDDDIEVYNHNKKIFNKQQLLNTIKINELILNNISNEKHIKIYKKYIIPIINECDNKPVNIFIKKLFGIMRLSVPPDTAGLSSAQVLLKAGEINLDPYTKSVVCFIIEKIYIKIYDLLGYKRYLEAVFIKKL